MHIFALFVHSVRLSRAQRDALVRTLARFLTHILTIVECAAKLCSPRVKEVRCTFTHIETAEPIRRERARARTIVRMPASGGEARKMNGLRLQFQLFVLFCVRRGRSTNQEPIVKRSTRYFSIRST